MFQAPSRTSTFVAPPVAINVEERYIFKLVKLTDLGVSPFADPSKNETFHSIEWTMNVAYAATRSPIFMPDGKAWEYVEQTTSKTGKNPRNGMVAKARTFIEAFIGHTVEDDEFSSDLPNQILNKYASGFFEYVDREAKDGSHFNKLQIMRLSAYRPEAVPAAPPVPPPPPPVATQSDIPF